MNINPSKRFKDSDSDGSRIGTALAIADGVGEAISAGEVRVWGVGDIFPVIDDGAVEFCAGAIVTPEANPIEPQLMKFEKKVEAGAEFFQTQAIYDLDKFAKFMEYARQFPVKILAGIILLMSARMAEYITENVPGVFVP